MKKIACFLAQGFEEVEALQPLNLLKRAGCQTIIVGVYEKQIKSSRGVTIVADTLLQDWDKDADCFILPGGMPGGTNLEKSKELKDLIVSNFQKGKLIAAMCSAPATALASWGILKGKKLTCYPDMAKRIIEGTYVETPLCVDGNLITAQGSGDSILFGFAIIEAFLGKDVIAKVKKEICYPYLP